ncbi:MAG TPA: class I SAM-dependent methyltransferase [Acidimicrobiales bacterium]|jgi:SAM-dependent methyltransferase|nr:class I SAM-dependent methyltransferase [Acidimicrobiales bacterium]
MDYDEQRAEGYDRRHSLRFAEADATAAFLAAQARSVAGDGRQARVLELGIGTGRLALPLAAMGLEVHGIDASAPMVARLRAKPGGGEIPVVVGDFADVGDLVAGGYDVVFVAFNSLFELPDQAAQCRCVAGAASRLGVGGRFVVEALAPELTRLEQSLTVVSQADDEVVLQATDHDPLDQVVRGHDVVLSPSGIRLSPWSVRYASVPEVDLMARLGGLELTERWGGWEGQPFAASSSRHVSVYSRP